MIKFWQHQKNTAFYITPSRVGVPLTRHKAALQPYHWPQYSPTDSLYGTDSTVAQLWSTSASIAPLLFVDVDCEGLLLWKENMNGRISCTGNKSSDFDQLFPVIFYFGFEQWYAFVVVCRLLDSLHKICIDVWVYESL